MDGRQLPASSATYLKQGPETPAIETSPVDVISVSDYTNEAVSESLPSVACQRCETTIALDPATMQVRGPSVVMTFGARYFGGARSVAETWEDSRRAVIETRGARRLERLVERVEFCVECGREVCPACSAADDRTCADCKDRRRAAMAGRMKRQHAGIGTVRRLLAMERAAVRDLRRAASVFHGASAGGAREMVARGGMAEVARISARAEAAERAAIATILQVSPRYRSTALLLGKEMEEEALAFRLELRPLIGELEQAAVPIQRPAWPSLSDARGRIAAMQATARQAIADRPVTRGLLAYSLRFLRRLVSASGTVAVFAVGLVVIVRLLANGAGQPLPTASPVTGGADRSGDSQVIAAEYGLYPLGSVREENWLLPARAALKVLPVAGERALQVTTPDRSEAVRVCNTFPPVGGATIRVSASVLVSDLPGTDMTVLALQRTGTETAAIRFTRDGYVVLSDGSRQLSTGRQYDAWTWYRVDLEVNPDDATYAWRVAERDAGTVVTEGEGGGSWRPLDEIDAACFETSAGQAGSSLHVGWLRVSRD